MRPVSYTHLDVYKRQGYESTEVVSCSNVKQISDNRWMFVYENVLLWAGLFCHLPVLIQIQNWYLLACSNRSHNFFSMKATLLEIYVHFYFWSKLKIFRLFWAIIFFRRKDYQAFICIYGLSLIHICHSVQRVLNRKNTY